MQLKEKTNASLKKALVILAVLVNVSILGCSRAPVRTPPEIWMIDPYNKVLYRKISPYLEEAIPFDSPAINKFVCMSEKDLKAIIRDLLEKRK